MKQLVTALVVISFLGWSAPAAAQAPTPEREALLTHILVGSMMVGHFTDISTTMYGIGGHRLKEANPALRWAQDKPIAMAISKGSIAAVSAGLLLKYHHKSARWSQIIAGGLSAGLFYISYRNSKLDKSLMTP